MVPVCVEMSGICVSPAYQAVTEVSGTIWVAVDSSGRPLHSEDADVARLGVHVFVTMSDSLQAESTAGLSLGPIIGRYRVYYAKVCTRSGWRCEYQWSAAPTEGPSSGLYLKSFAIEGRSAEGLQQAQQHIWLRIGAPNDQAYVPVTDLTADTGRF